MGYRNLQACISDLAATGQLLRIEEEIDARLEAAEIHRRVQRAGGPAIFFARVRGCRFPMVSNLFGTLERAKFLFRDTLDHIQRLIELKLDPAQALRRPAQYLPALPAAWSMWPRRVAQAPVLAATTAIDQLPQLQSWPDDGGPFITLPLVYTEDAGRPGWRHSNLGMYRVQLAGNQYAPNREVGLHYQIHRGIGVHHAEARRRGEPLRVNVFVGGAPAMMLAAVMPLPEGVPELSFAGALAGHRIPLASMGGGLPIYAEADFCITGTIDPDRQLPEGPFGDHLGYYSLQHDFPVLRVEQVYHRQDAVWPFTVVGRPPQEDTIFGRLIHELTGPAIPAVIPGVRAVHAVDAAGVHPLLLAIGSERYTPYAEPGRPQELLTQANAILGQGQMSLAKFLLIVDGDDDPSLDLKKGDWLGAGQAQTDATANRDVPVPFFQNKGDWLGAGQAQTDATAGRDVPVPFFPDRQIVLFLRHLLERVDWQRDLHFQTRTTIDTLDYSGSGLNQGSKLVIAAAGPPRRKLAAEVPVDLKLPDGFHDPRLCLPGVLAIQSPKFIADGQEPARIEQFCSVWQQNNLADSFPLAVLVDDSDFAAQALNNFLWVAFTRSNPAADVHGCGAATRQKHWGCVGPLVIDARIKPHHAPPLVEDPAVSRRVDALCAPGGPLHGIS